MNTNNTLRRRLTFPHLLLSNSRAKQVVVNLVVSPQWSQKAARRVWMLPSNWFGVILAWFERTHLKLHLPLLLIPNVNAYCWLVRGSVALGQLIWFTVPHSGHLELIVLVTRGSVIALAVALRHASFVIRNQLLFSHFLIRVLGVSFRER